MSKYGEIRAAAKKGHNNRYATGGAVKRKNATTVVNVITGAAPATAAPAGPMGGAPASPPMPPPAVPPVAGNAALGAMGAPPMLATGGRVKAGAATGVHRTQMQKKRP